VVDDVWTGSEGPADGTRVCVYATFTDCELEVEVYSLGASFSQHISSDSWTRRPSCFGAGHVVFASDALIVDA